MHTSENRLDQPPQNLDSTTSSDIQTQGVKIIVGFGAMGRKNKGENYEPAFLNGGTVKDVFVKRGTLKGLYEYRILGASVKVRIFKGAEHSMEHKFQRAVYVIYHRVEILRGDQTVGTITIVVTAHCEVATAVYSRFINSLKKLLEENGLMYDVKIFISLSDPKERKHSKKVKALPQPEEQENQCEDNIIFLAVSGGFFSNKFSDDGKLTKKNRLNAMIHFKLQPGLSAKVFVVASRSHNDRFMQIAYNYAIGKYQNTDIDAALNASDCSVLALSSDKKTTVEITKENFLPFAIEVYSFTKGKEKKRIKTIVETAGKIVGLTPEEIKKFYPSEIAKIIKDEKKNGKIPVHLFHK